MSLIRLFYTPLTAGTHLAGVAGDFTAWKIVPMTEQDGVFQYLMDLPEGRYHYKFIVDGVWLCDPQNTLSAPDPYGGCNSLLIVEHGTQPVRDWNQVLALQQTKNLSELVQVFRSGTAQGELRLIWPAGMADQVWAVIGPKKYLMSRLGGTTIQDTFHLLLNHESIPALLPGFSCTLELHYKSHTLYIGVEGVCSDQDCVQPYYCPFSELEIFSVPTWINEAVIYQIFPDRFCNGDPTRNPNFSQWYYFDCKTPPLPGEYLAPEKEYYHFVDDWDDISGLIQSPWLPEGKPDWWSFYGGDIAGVRSKLAYLLELGINTIYFNPLWQAKSNHKYDAADYHSIDPQFASTEELIDFVELAHSLGLRIVLDVALNHTGETFWAFRDCVEKGAASPYWNWYDWQKWPLPKPLPADFKPKEYYQCWWGIKDMPDLNYDLQRFHPVENEVKDIKEASPNWPLVNYLLETVRWWLGDIGIDGFRLDVPDEVPYWFWELFRQQVKSINPEAWIVGEIWHHAEDWVNARYFDSVMNYACFKNPVLDYFILDRITTDEFIQSMEAGLSLYPWHALQAMMNLLGSHDTLRLFTVARGNIARIKLAVLFQMCFIGAPHVYYGDEIALPGGKDPDNRRPFNWNWQEDLQARELHQFYLDLIIIRKLHSALSQGKITFKHSHHDILTICREDSRECIMVYLNASSKAKSYKPALGMELLYQTNVNTQSRLAPYGAVIMCQPKDRGREMLKDYTPIS